MISQSVVCPAGKSPSEACYQAIKRIGALCNVRIIYAAVLIGFSSFPVHENENGNVWCWGDADGRFTNGSQIYMYTKSIGKSILMEKWHRNMILGMSQLREV